ncbi:hypothetical protein [Salipiger sp. IMCC34102]|uniref:hypothetical protein n=1 Tax=Salipiger sp. IMCC34102 TaxID=2510647 RepID=UPI001F5CAFEC|nr:hypothetical protein [Salipiger sp. IMCC34102]
MTATTFMTPTLKTRTTDALMRALHGLAAAMETYADSHDRSAQIEALQDKSDAELARMGLSRDRIVHHVFRDILYI